MISNITRSLVVNVLLNLTVNPLLLKDDLTKLDIQNSIKKKRRLFNITNEKNKFKKYLIKEL